MARFDTTAPAPETEATWTPLETAVYPMKIIEAKIAPAHFPDDRGDHPDYLTIVWALNPKTQEQKAEFTAAGYESGQKVWQRIKWYLGNTKTGAPSRARQFLDQFIADGDIPANVDIAIGDEPATSGDLVGIERYVVVEKYLKEQGDNAGMPGNRVKALLAKKTADGSAARSPTPTQAMTRGNTAIRQQQQDEELPWNPPELTPEREQLLSEARTLAKTAGGHWLNKRFHEEPDDELRHMIGRMERQIERNDPNRPLFEETT